MARLSVSILKDLGVDQAQYPVELPLYSRFRPETTLQSGTLRTRSVPQDISKQELSAVILQLTDFRHFRRFLTMPLLVHATERDPGPASVSYFRVRPSDRGLDPMLDYPAEFRNELSLAHSDLFFLKPHALVLSVIEDRDVLDYFDPQKYLQACQTYPNNTCPLADLDRCFVSNHRSWYQLYRDRGLVN